MDDLKKLADARWYVGSMNDGCFIIDKPPRPSHDYPNHDADVQCITGFPMNCDATFKAAQAICDAHNAQIDALAPAAAAQRVPECLYVECCECSNCGHAGINDDSSNSNCNTCDWSGPSPIEDRCPGCGRDGTMCPACPECGSRYTLVAAATIASPAAQQAAEPTDPTNAMLAPLVREFGCGHSKAWAVLVEAMKAAPQPNGGHMSCAATTEEEYDSTMLDRFGAAAEPPTDQARKGGSNG